MSATPAHRTIKTALVPVPANLRAFFVSAEVSVKLHGSTRGSAKGRKHKPFEVKVHGRKRSERHEPDPFKRKGLGHG